MKDPLRWLDDGRTPAALREVLASRTESPQLSARLHRQFGRFAERLVAGSIAAGGGGVVASTAAAAGQCATVGSAAGAVGGAAGAAGGAATAGQGGTLGTGLTVSSGSMAAGAAPAVVGASSGTVVAEGAAIELASAGAAAVPGVGLGAQLLAWGTAGAVTKSACIVALAGAVAATAAYMGSAATNGHDAGRPGLLESRTTPSRSAAPSITAAANRAATSELQDETWRADALRTERGVGHPRAGGRGASRASAATANPPKSQMSAPQPNLAFAANGTPQPSEAAFGEPTLLEEARTLEKARSAVQSDPALALELVNDHQRDYPTGQLSAERELIAIQALMRLGRRDEALRRAAPSLNRAPRSLYAKRLRSIIGAE